MGEEEEGEREREGETVRERQMRERGEGDGGEGDGGRESTKLGIKIGVHACTCGVCVHVCTICRTNSPSCCR